MGNASMYAWLQKNLERISWTKRAELLYESDSEKRCSLMEIHLGTEARLKWIRHQREKVLTIISLKLKLRPLQIQPFSFRERLDMPILSFQTPRIIGALTNLE